MELQNHNQVTRQIFNIFIECEKTSSLQNLLLNCQDIFCIVSNPLKNMDNPPNHNDEKLYLVCLFSHNNRVNTMTCILEHHFFHHVTQQGHKFSLRCRLWNWACLMDTLSCINCSWRASVCNTNWHQDAVRDTFMLMRNAIQNGFTEIIDV